MRRSIPISGLALAAAAVLLAGCTTQPAPERSSRVPTPSGSATAGMVVPQGTPSDVVTGLDAPWSVVRDGDTVLVSERDSGRILQLVDGRTREVGTVDGVRHGGEGGLLGLAIHDRGLYVYSTGSNGNRIDRYALTGSGDRRGLGAREEILSGLPSNSIHNGGRIAFGPDGMLYASVGDAGDGSNAQDRDSLGGKILRMTPTGAVPDDNPFANSLVYSLGHRNVQGLGWAADGTMFAAEFGQNTWDELNVIEPGKNYGWPEVEGRATGGSNGDFVDPVQQWPTSEASPSGLAVIDGTVFVANLKGERVRAIPVADPGTATDYWSGEYGRIRTVLAGPDDTLWVVTNNTDGRGSPKDGDDRILSVPLGAS